jgi:hypothetical protein
MIMRNTVLCGLAAALLLGGVAQTQAQAQTAAGPAETAQPPAATATAPAAPAAAAATPATADSLKPGLEIKDPTGASIGTVVKAGKASNGQTAVVVSMDGKEVSLPLNLFSMNGEGVTSSVTKAQIQAAMAKG